MATRPASRRVRALGLGLLAVAVFALAACNNNPPDTPRARAGRCQIGMVGDSLTVGVRDYGGIKQKLYDNVCSITDISGKVGRLTSTGATIVEGWKAAGTLPSILIVGLGTNDCTASVFERHARRILAAAGPTRPIVWINTWNPRCATAINGVITKLQAESRRAVKGGRIWILDHHGWISTHKQYLAGDGIHLTTAGYRAHAQRIVDLLGIRRR